MKHPSRQFLAAATVMALFMARPSLAGTVTILTSFPRELTRAYQLAFEAGHPGIRLQILNKNTVQSVAYVRELPAGHRPEVFWASAPDAFELMARQKLLEKIDDLINKEAPQSAGPYPINNPEGYYLGQALAGYGLMWNTRYLAAKRLPPPREWADLARPVYFGHVAMSSPSRSGSTHLTVETLLQGEGWERGWGLLLQIAGNCAAITERSFGVPEGVNSGQFGIGLVIDFLGLASRYAGYPVQFAYPEMTAIVPANIALVAGSRNPGEARQFIAFTLSRAGQQLLVDPRIARLPILPPQALTVAPPPGYPDAFQMAARAKVRFDPALSGRRYKLVSAMFDQTITFRLPELQAATRAIQEGEALLEGRPDAAAASLLRQARQLAYAPLVDARPAEQTPLEVLFAAGQQPDRATALEARWSRQARDHYEQARVMAEQAARLLR